MIAGFIFLRLRGILGKRTGFDGKAPAQFKEILKTVKQDQKKLMKILMKMHKMNFLKEQKLHTKQ